MASKSIKKGFTLLESIVVLALFASAILIVSQMYVGLTKSTILAQDLQVALDNVRYGSEKLWAEIKNGSDFVLTTSSIEFKDRRCRLIKIYRDNDNIIYEINNQKNLPLFDNNLVTLKDFRVFYDKTISNNSQDPYFKTANKIIILNYTFDLKTRTLSIPFSVSQGVAPANSVFLSKPCQ